MRILIDGDGFPNISEIVQIGQKYNIEVIIYIDEAHELNYRYAKIITVPKASNSVDLYIENTVLENDLVLTNDYGVAVISLSKGAIVLNSLGNLYNVNSIDYILEIKNVTTKLRKNKIIKGPKKRTIKDKIKLLKKIEIIVRSDKNEEKK